mgnify:CR=1 FL=1
MIETIKRYEKRISDLQFILSVFILNIAIDIAKAPILVVLEQCLGETDGLLEKDIASIIFLCLIAPIKCILIVLFIYFQHYSLLFSNEVYS